MDRFQVVQFSVKSSITKHFCGEMPPTLPCYWYMILSSSPKMTQSTFILQLDLQYRGGAGWQWSSGYPGYQLCWGWLLPGPQHHQGQIPGADRCTQTEPVAEPWYTRCLSRLLRLQRQHQPLLCYQVSSWLFSNPLMTFSGLKIQSICISIHPWLTIVTGFCQYSGLCSQTYFIVRGFC